MKMLPLLQPTNRGWTRVWDWIRSKFGDEACKCECCGEAWQYMGSAESGHQFRHRDFRGSGRVYETVPLAVDDYIVSGPLRIAFCGASGTGKTTLATYAAEFLGLEINPVGSRSVSKSMGFASPYDVDAAGRRGEFQRSLQTKKIDWENTHSSFVTDRSTLDELVYTIMHDVSAASYWYFDRAREHMNRYTHVVYCPVSVFCKIGGDPHRVNDMVYQEIFDTVLDGFLTKWLATPQMLRIATSELAVRKEELKSFLGEPS